MAEFGKYDEVLTSILVNEKSIIGFLSTVFNFLARRTDFYYVPAGPYENMGFPPGVAEELTIKVLKSCDPKNWKGPNGAKQSIDVNNEIMCSTVAQEVEVIAEEDQENTSDSENAETTDVETSQIQNTTRDNTESIPEQNTEATFDSSFAKDHNYVPPVIPTQKNSESYNGAQRENYSWSQTIMEIDITVNLPPDIKSSKDLKVTLNPGDICIAIRNGPVLFKDSLPYKIKTLDSFWSISERKLLIHLEKVQERWWNKLLNSEEPIDLSKIDCSRSLYELPEDHIAKVHEMQWNQERKMKGLPTSDQIRNVEILKKAWDADGSPFKGQKFDPNILNQ